ncbi:MAG: molybdopterin-dependent oxidoreductase [Oscillospiraceae bacterium]|jgi:anaerobic selenocysteine-containing dehydrogenase|nr:molybdopterin-dependent oxidoreductase [Oscillospiraceae bacterium]
MAHEYDRIERTTVWSPGAGCHGGCGVLAYMNGDKLVKIEGDPCHPWNQGRTCSRLLAYTRFLYHKDRILYPLKRVGERGSGKFERISWEEALDTVETKFKAIRDEYGAESVIFVQGTGRDINAPLTFLTYAYGSPNLSQLGLSGQSCYTPRITGSCMVDGTLTVADCSQFFEKRYDDPRWQCPKYIVVWATNPGTGCPDGFQGHWVVDCMKRGSKLIVIDPRATWFSSRAEHFLQCRPGTDGAIALGMINLIIENEWYDKEFVEKWTMGLDKLAERAREYTPERVERLTWVPREVLYEATRAYALNRPSAIHWGMPIDMNPEATTAAQAIAMLWCLTGNFDVPGGNVAARGAFGIAMWPINQAQVLGEYGEEFLKKVNEKRIGAREFPYIANTRLYIQPDLAVEQMLTGDPYPIKGMWIQTSNLLGGNAADLNKHHKALMNVPFNVVVDLFHNPTTMAIADLILPAACFTERNTIRVWHTPAQTVRKLHEPLGEARNDWDINFELALRFNPALREKYGKVEDFFDAKLKPSGYTFEQLIARGGWVFEEDGVSVPYRRHERGLLRADGQPGFQTPSGKVEFYSLNHEAWGLDPLPWYREPPESENVTPELMKKYPLVMVTGRRSPVYFHAEHRNIDWLREVDPFPLVEVNPNVAKRLNLDDGEWCWIENDRGRVTRKVKYNISMNEKCVSVPHGWWPPEEEGKAPHYYGAWKYNCNKLVLSQVGSSSGYGGGAYKTVPVRLRKMEPGETYDGPEIGITERSEVTA